jgi:1,4-alpha-glucan branching enzyme
VSGVAIGQVRDPGATFVTDDDIYLFNEGSHLRLYDALGAHATELDGVAGVRFAVWAPNAETVAVIGDFNEWDGARHRLFPRASSGIWQGFVPGLETGALYKFRITARDGYLVEKADPIAYAAEVAPRTASQVWDLDYTWGDGGWMGQRAAVNALDAPISIYEVHLGSWRRSPDEGNRSLTYREIAPLLAEHITNLDFTHVEFLPLMEHPFFGSWGYQTTGYFAPTSRYGTPQDLMFLIDTLHQAGIGVILDWVPSHFPSDLHALGFFDGSNLYEHSDPREGWHPDWQSLIFNYGRHEVRSFLLSSALFWLEAYHADGLRVDAVASMLYRDYSREQGEWIPNEWGGRENLEAIGFLRRLNEEVYRNFPDTQTYAEESTAWPMVSRPTSSGGLGFGLKWDMGWMHDTLEYVQHDPIHRAHHHDDLTFRAIYAGNENFLLPLSHDEVVHGKGSLLARMPGDEFQRFANMRLLYAYQFATPGKKLVFMGGEFGQSREWNHDSSLDWHLLEYPVHAGLQTAVGSLARLYRDQPALHRGDCEPAGFDWVIGDDADNSVLAFLRRSLDPDEVVLVICNFTPVVRTAYRVGVPVGGVWRELLNTDAPIYGGTGVGNLGQVEAEDIAAHGREHSLSLTVPPLAAIFLAPRGGDS